ncbi:uncharacterized protein O3C94_016716 [Discoglossus pictus]
MTDKMNKETKDLAKVAKRFLNQALEIIYLLTGEEYTIVKKNVPLIHQLTGQVSIKCDDVAIYFSMEEWEYIEGHKELYKGVMIENQQTPMTLGIQTNSSSGLQDKNKDTVILCDEGEDEREQHGVQQQGNQSKSGHQEETLEMLSVCEDAVGESEKMNIQQEQICPVPCTGGSMSRNLMEETNRAAVKELVKDDISMFEKDQDAEPERTSPKESASIKEEDLPDSSVSYVCRQTSFVQHKQFVQEFSDATHKTRIVKKTETTNYAKGFCPENRTSHTEEKVEPMLMVANYAPQTGEKHESTLMGANYASQTGEKHEPTLMGATYAPQTGEKHEPTLMGANYAPQTGEKHEPTLMGANYAPQTGEKHEPTLMGANYAPQTREKHEPTFMVANHPPQTGEKNEPTLMVANCGEYICDISNVWPDCEKGITTQAKLVKNQKLHIGEKPYVCQTCGKGFLAPSILIVHNRIHTGEKPYVCPQCGKCFSQKSSLGYHQVIHTGKKSHVCQICGKSFINRSKLTTHYRTHTGEKPYVCQICEKSFSDKTNLIVHNRTHTGEKPHICQICAKRFSHKPNLVAHQRTHM